MPVRSVIDKNLRLVVTTEEGCVTFADMRANQDRLLDDPEFDPEFSQQRLPERTGATRQRSKTSGGQTKFQDHAKTAGATVSPTSHTHCREITEFD